MVYAPQMKYMNTMIVQCKNRLMAKMERCESEFITYHSDASGSDFCNIEYRKKYSIFI